MDFFQAQEAARKRTGLLVALFLGAVIGIIVVVYAVVHIAIGPGAGPPDPFLLLQVAAGVSLVVLIGSASRTASLRRGGPAVAELLGGRRIAPDTTDVDERRLLNIVEEMALASGVPVPAVYVMDGEDAINAFAAGYALNDAAIAVTRGALRTFTRDELQGVIAHEFSHVLNGDMRLNIRLIGILYGILLLSVIGRGILQHGPRARGRDRDNGGAAILLIAFALVVVGYVGVFFGKLIKAAVSRQREYLADSAAVEFTRNPDGLANALKKIAGAPRGSRIENHHAEELSHLFFADGMRAGIAGMLATHPPLEERIRRLDPTWEGGIGTDGVRVASPDQGREQVEIAGATGLATGAVRAGIATNPPSSASEAVRAGRRSSGELIASVGAPTRAHLDYADELLAELPQPLADAAHSTDGAAALVFALIASTGDDAGAARVAEVARHNLGNSGIADRIPTLVPLIHAFGSGRRIPLLELLLPALGTTSPAEREQLLRAIDLAIRADGQIRVFEVALRHVVARQLAGPDRVDRGARSGRSAASLRADAETILSALAWTGGGWRPEPAARAFAAGAARIGGDALALHDPSTLSVEQLDRSLTAFQYAAMAVRREFLEACAACAAHDRRIDQGELEILVAVSAALDCPMPPIL